MTSVRVVDVAQRTYPRDAALTSIAAYAAVAMPLAMAALPLYVHLPRYYGESMGVGLAALGATLLGLRVLDALLDPLIGALSDRFATRRAWVAAAFPVLAIGLIALFLPPVRGDTALLIWLGISLAVVYTAFSVATINHGAWGAELSSDPVERTRITALREALALVGVVVASIGPTWFSGTSGADAGLQRFALAFAPFAGVCLALTWLAPVPPPPPRASGRLFARVVRPLSDPMFRRLLAVFLANGIASAIPATLVLFYVADVLRDEARQGWFLALYFVAGAAGMPLWLRVSAQHGKTLAWSIGMVVSIASFVWAGFLQAGDSLAFAVICALSGFALGADLALPPSMLADIVGRKQATASAGAYFGVWTLATKLNLALAAGIALPLLAAFGYSPVSGDMQGVSALSLIYAVVPCALKLVALAGLVAVHRSYRRIDE